MTATEVLRQKSRLRTPEMNIRVPDILEFPEKYHDLFYKIGRASFVQFFSARETPKGYVLSITLRNGERPNIVVVQRVKQLFKSVLGAVYPNSFDSPSIEIIIPL